MHKVVHILAIVVAQTKELLYISDTSEYGLLKNSHKLGWVCADPAMANYMAQVVNLALKKHIFLHLHIKLVSAKAGQDGMEVMQVLLEGTTIHKDVF